MNKQNIMISDIIKSIAAVGSTNAKRAILGTQKGNQTLRKLFYATYDGSINYWIKADKNVIGTGNQVITEELINDILRTLNGRELTGNAARAYLAEVVSSLTADESIIITRMINRDLECKASSSLANATWPKLIRDFPVMLAGKFDTKTAKPFYAAETAESAPARLIVQKKADGGRAEAVVSKDGKVAIFSRNGNELLTHGVFDFLSCFAGYVVDGEFVSIDPVTRKIRDRKTGNGLYNKCVRNTISEEEAKTLHYIVWDIIPIDDFFAGYCKTPYEERLEQLIAGLPNNMHVSLIETERIHTVAQATAFYGRMLSEKEEGAMLKLAEAPWEDDRSKNVLKLKEELSATLYCYAVKPHSKKPGQIGSLECKSACGMIDVSIGTGLNDDDRVKPPSYFIGSLIDMKYNQLIKAKNSDTYSMFLPVYYSIRTDVSSADTLDHLK